MPTKWNASCIKALPSCSSITPRAHEPNWARCIKDCAAWSRQQRQVACICLQREGRLHPGSGITYDGPTNLLCGYAPLPNVLFRRVPSPPNPVIHSSSSVEPVLDWVRAWKKMCKGGHGRYSCQKEEHALIFLRTHISPKSQTWKITRSLAKKTACGDNVNVGHKRFYYVKEMCTWKWSPSNIECLSSLAASSH